MSLVSVIKAPLGIASAIKKASRATGADFSYLLKTAARESSFQKSAKAKTSSAAGLFQFIENTWLKTVKEAGDRFGLGKYTPHIFKTRSGRHYVPNGRLRKEILQLRHNPEISAMMAGAFTQKNSEFVATRLGREPSEGELYIAHFLGPRGAAELISLAESKPNTRADRHFPRAARANKPIFYSRRRPRTVAQVYNELVSEHVKLQASAAKPAQAAPKPAPATITKAIVTKPKAEPVKQHTPAPARLYKASLSRTPETPAAQLSKVQAGHDETLGEGVKVKEAVGLLGQKGSPIAATTKVAALTRNGLNIAPGTLNDAAPGSLGIWTTQIHYPADETANTNSSTKQHEKEPSGVRSRAAKRRQGSRSLRLLEQSAKRNARRASIRTASVAHSLRVPDFWEQMGLNGN